MQLTQPRIFRAVGFTNSSHNPLDFSQIFFVKQFCKERLDIDMGYFASYGRYFPSDRSGWSVESALEKLDIDSPELRHIAEETIRKYICQSGEKATDQAGVLESKESV